MKVDEGGAFFFLTVLLKVSLCSQRLFIWKWGGVVIFNSKNTLQENTS